MKFLNRVITILELEQALKMTKENKSPGIDGISANFYKNCFQIIGEPLTKVLNNCFCMGPRTDLGIFCQGGAATSWGGAIILIKNRSRARVCARNTWGFGVLQLPTGFRGKALEAFDFKGIQRKLKRFQIIIQHIYEEKTITISSNNPLLGEL